MAGTAIADDRPEKSYNYSKQRRFLLTDGIPVVKVYEARL